MLTLKIHAATLIVFLTVSAGFVKTKAADCNRNGIEDVDEIRDRLVEDCNANGVPDGCDVSGAQIGLNAVLKYRIQDFGGAFVGGTCDLDGDGDDDLVLAEPETLALLRNHGDGQLSIIGRVPIGAGAEIDVMRLADMDGDADLDIVASKYSDERGAMLTIIENLGAAVFEVRYEYDDLASFGAIEITDVDLDGDTDVLAIGFFDSDLYVYLNRGNGELEAPRKYPIDRDAVDFTVGDFDGDGDADAVEMMYEKAGVAIYENTGGAFSFVRYLGDLPVWNAAASDTDGDGRTDLIVAEIESDGIWWVTHYRGRRVFEFDEPMRYPVDSFPLHIRPDDLNLDDDIDLAVLGSYDQITIFDNRGNGTFDVGPAMVVSQHPAEVWPVDLNSDGQKDLIALTGASHDIGIAFSDGLGGYAAAETVTALTKNDPWLAFDVESDRDLDMAVISHEGAVGVMLNDGGGVFDKLIWVPQVNLASDVAAGDLDGDGDIDLAGVGRQSDGFFTVARNRGDLKFTRVAPVIKLSNSAGAYQIEFADLDADGDLDAVAVKDGKESLYVLVNDGDAHFKLVHTYELDSGMTMLRVGDLNADGAAEAIFHVTDRANFEVLWNRGDASFPDPVEITLAAPPIDLLVRDLNADGRPDVAVSYDRPEGGGELLLNNGEGRFESASMLDLGQSATDIAAADLDRDGDFDLIASNASESQLVVLRQDEGLSFARTESVQAGREPARLVCGDFDGDADDDLFVEDSRSHALLLVRSTPGTSGSPDDNETGIPDECERRSGDLNCDGDVSFDDIDPFALAVSDPDGYHTKFPACLLINGDFDGNGGVDFSDIDPFVTCLVGGECR